MYILTYKIRLYHVEKYRRKTKNIINNGKEISKSRKLCSIHWRKKENNTRQSILYSYLIVFLSLFILVVLKKNSVYININLLLKKLNIFLHWITEKPGPVPLAVHGMFHLYISCTLLWVWSSYTYCIETEIWWIDLHIFSSYRKIHIFIL